MPRLGLIVPAKLPKPDLDHKTKFAWVLKRKTNNIRKIRTEII